MVASAWEEEGEWRGEEIAISKTLGKHKNSCVRAGAISTVIKDYHQHTWGIISGHIPHHATVPQTEEILHGWGNTAATRQQNVFLGADLNETPAQCEIDGLPTPETRSGTARGNAQLNWLAMQELSLPQQRTHVPSHFPYNTDMAPRRLDYVATKKVRTLTTQVGDCRDIASSDHEPVILTAVRTPGQKPPRGPTWGPRQLVPDYQQRLREPDHIAGDREAIAQRAAHITAPSSKSNGFRESEQLRQMRREAHTAPAGAERRRMWKGIAKNLKAERRIWHRNLTTQAAAGSWGGPSVRSRPRRPATGGQPS